MAQHVKERELIEAEFRFWQAIKERDAKKAAELSDNPCIITGAQGVGVIEPRQFAGMMKAAPYKLDDYELKDVKVQMLTDDVAVLAYKVHEELTVDGKPVTLDASDSSTWVRRNGRWLCALHTEALSGDPYGRDRPNAQT